MAGGISAVIPIGKNNILVLAMGSSEALTGECSDIWQSALAFRKIGECGRSVQLDCEVYHLEAKFIIKTDFMDFEPRNPRCEI